VVSSKRTAGMEMFKLADVNRANERMLKSDVMYRFAIDWAWRKA
jgi:D-arabinose 1-dehydrogenase-like Zn-dependent alcohol dehydrogenase